MNQIADSGVMDIIVLNSGSNGNAVYVESKASGNVLLLDCGISRREIETRLKVHGKSLFPEIPVFVTHEHADHVRGLATLSKVYHARSYLTEPTYRNLWDRISVKGFQFIGNTQEIRVGDLTVTAFPKSHDAADPVGFIVETGGVRFLYATDLGTIEPHLHPLLAGSDAALIESNYDAEMLLAGSYPLWLKNRVQSDVGHLSNTQTSEFVEASANGKLRTLIYGHLSENNNSPELVLQEWEKLRARIPAFNPRFHIASRNNVGDIITI